MQTTESAAATAVHPGVTVPGYVYLGELGSGGMGRVILARCGQSHELVAIKFLVSTKDAISHEHRLRFQREIEILERVRHPHIINLREQGIVDGIPFLVMDYASGGTLRKRLIERKTLSVGETREIIDQAISGLSAMEVSGIIHRDLKPENVLLDRDGTIKIADFGIAVVETEVGSLTKTVQVLGTFDYMSPEQRARLPVDSRADQYSLAVMLYEMLAGKRPVGSFKPVSQLNAAVSADLDVVLERALREDPDERFPDFGALSLAIQNSLVERKSSRKSRLIGRMVAIAAVLVAMVVAMSWGSFGAGRSAPPTSTSPTSTSPTSTPSTSSPPNNARSAIFPQSLELTTNPVGNSGVERSAEGQLALRVGTSDRTSPDNQAKLESLLAAGNQALADGKTELAGQRFEAASEMAPLDYRAHLGLARVHKSLGNTDAAKESIEVALALNPTDPEVIIGLGAIQYNLKEYDRAKHTLSPLLDSDSCPEEAVAYYAACLYSQGKKESAFKQVAEVIEREPLAYSSRSFRSTWLFQAQQYDAAMRDALIVLFHNPSEHRAHLTMINSILRKRDSSADDYQLALVYADHFLAITHGRLLDPYHLKAQALDRLGKFDEALASYDLAILSVPRSSREKAVALRKSLQDNRANAAR